MCGGFDAVYGVEGVGSGGEAGVVGGGAGGGKEGVGVLGVVGEGGAGAFVFLRFRSQMLSQTGLRGVKYLTSRWGNDKWCAGF